MSRSISNRYAPRHEQNGEDSVRLQSYKHAARPAVSK